MSELRSFAVIREISCDPANEDRSELDAYLEAGWALVDIHKRDYHDPQTNEERKISVYILGHSDPQATAPKID